MYMYKTMTLVPDRTMSYLQKLESVNIASESAPESVGYMMSFDLTCNTSTTQLIMV